MSLMMAAFGLVLLANVWVVGLAFVTWWTIYMVAIRHEEAYLTQEFGGVYYDYKTTVRRWL
ncbi:MAG: hypothetical protein ABGX04_09625 [Myxococcales bacterium]